MPLDFDLSTVIADLQRDEDTKLFVYDDATGKFIKPGSIVVGHPTIGTGRALDTHGISGPEGSLLLSNDIDGFSGAITSALPWLADLDPVRRGVILEMSFNLGVNGLCGFRQMLIAVQARNWTVAAGDMKASHWYLQVGARGDRLAQKMLTGKDL